MTALSVQTHIGFFKLSNKHTDLHVYYLSFFCQKIFAYLTYKIVTELTSQFTV